MAGRPDMAWKFNPLMSFAERAMDYGKGHVTTELLRLKEALPANRFQTIDLPNHQGIFVIRDKNLEPVQAFSSYLADEVDIVKYANDDMAFDHGGYLLNTALLDEVRGEKCFPKGGCAPFSLYNVQRGNARLDNVMSDLFKISRETPGAHDPNIWELNPQWNKQGKGVHIDAVKNYITGPAGMELLINHGTIGLNRKDMGEFMDNYRSQHKDFVMATRGHIAAFLNGKEVIHSPGIGYVSPLREGGPDDFFFLGHHLAP